MNSALYKTCFFLLCLCIHSGTFAQTLKDSLLLDAVKDDNYERVVSLIRQGADVNEKFVGYKNNKNEIYMAPLVMFAVAYSSLDVFRVLFNQDDAEREGVLSVGARVYSSIASIAAGESKVDILDYLIRENHIDLEKPSLWIKDQAQYTPLQVACRYGNEAVVRLLLERGANPYILSEDKTLVDLTLEVWGKDMAKKLILLEEYGIKSHSGENALQTAIKKEYGPQEGSVLVTIVYNLLEAGFPTGELDEDGNTTLHLLFQALERYKSKRIGIFQDGRGLIHGNATVVFEFIYDKGIAGNPDIHARNNQGETLLSLALKYGYTKLAKDLLARGADVNNVNQKGETPLSLAVNAGDASLVKSLIDKGADVNNANSLGKSLLHVSVKNKNTRIIDHLLQTDIQLPNDHKMDTTILEYVFQEKLNVHYALECVQRGASIALLDSLQNNLLHRVASYYNWNLEHDSLLVDLVKALLENGIDFNAKNSKQQTPLTLFLEAYNVNYQIIDLLLAKGAIYEGTMRSMTGFSVPADSVDFEHLKSIIRKIGVNTLKFTSAYDQDVYGRDDYKRENYIGANLLFFALLQNNLYSSNAENYIKFLLDQGIQVNYRIPNTPKGWTALHQACLARDMPLSMLKELLKRKLDPNAVVYDEYYHDWTPLHFAASKNNAEAIQLLLTYAADPTLKNQQGDTPLDIALALGHKEALLALDPDFDLSTIKIVSKSDFEQAWEALRNTKLDSFLQQNPDFDINKPNEQGETLLTKYIKSWNVRLATLDTLLRKGANPNVRPNENVMFTLFKKSYSYEYERESRDLQLLNFFRTLHDDNIAFSGTNTPGYFAFADSANATQFYRTALFLYDPDNFEFNSGIIQGLRNDKRIDFERLKNLSNVTLERLNLSHRDLLSLSDKIEELTYLQYLNLSNNQLETLPGSIGNLKNLKFLDVSHNRLASLPKSIGKLKNLEVLILDYNQLTQLPKSIANLQKLKVLTVYNNQLQELPARIGKLQTLRRLNVAYNQLEALPTSFVRLKGLKVLSVHNNAWQIVPKSIQSMRHINYLSKTSAPTEKSYTHEYIHLRHFKNVNFTPYAKQLVRYLMEGVEESKIQVYHSNTLSEDFSRKISRQKDFFDYFKYYDPNFDDTISLRPDDCYLIKLNRVQTNTTDSEIRSLVLILPKGETPQSEESSVEVLVFRFDEVYDYLDHLYTTSRIDAAHYEQLEAVFFNYQNHEEQYSYADALLQRKYFSIPSIDTTIRRNHASTIWGQENGKIGFAHYFKYDTQPDSLVMNISNAGPYWAKIGANTYVTSVWRMINLLHKTQEYDEVLPKEESTQSYPWEEDKVKVKYRSQNRRYSNAPYRLKQRSLNTYIIQGVREGKLIPYYPSNYPTTAVVDESGVMEKQEFLANWRYYSPVYGDSLTLYPEDVSIIELKLTYAKKQGEVLAPKIDVLTLVIPQGVTPDTEMGMYPFASFKFDELAAYLEERYQQSLEKGHPDSLDAVYFYPNNPKKHISLAQALQELRFSSLIFKMANPLDYDIISEVIGIVGDSPQVYGLILNKKYQAEDYFKTIHPNEPFENRMKRLLALSMFWLPSFMMAQETPLLSDAELEQKPWRSLQEVITQIAQINDNKIDENIKLEIANILANTYKIRSNGKINTIPTQVFTLCENLQVLDLSGSEMNELPATILLGKKLTSLDVSDNNLYELPAGIAVLKNLRHINVSENQLYQIPSDVWYLPHLKTLNWSRNALRNLPSEISLLNELERLHVSYNSLDSLPASIGQLDKLTYLNISSNYLQKLPEEIKYLKNLRELHIGISNDRGDDSQGRLSLIPTMGKFLTNLKVLRLSHMNYKKLPDEVTQIASLEELYLDNMRFLEKLPDEILLLKRLKVLDLGGSTGKLAWEGKLPPSIGGLTNLNRLILPTRATQLPIELSNLPNLDYLEVGKNYLGALNMSDLPSSGYLDAIPGELGLSPLDNLKEERYNLKQTDFIESHFEYDIRKLRVDPQGEKLYIYCRGYYAADQVNLIRVLNYGAWWYNQNGDYAKAQAAIDQAETIQTNITQSTLSSFLKIRLENSKDLLKTIKGSIQKGIDLLDEREQALLAKRIAQEKQALAIKLRQEAEANEQKALKNEKLAKRLKEQSEKRLIAFQEQVKIAKANEQKARISEANANEQRNYAILAGIIALVLFIIAIGFFFRQRLFTTKIKEQNRDIESQRSQLQEKTHELESLAEELRQQSDTVQVQRDDLIEKTHELESLAEELRQQYDVVDAKNHELLALQSTKDLMISAVNHDLRNPLNPIINFSGNYPKKTEKERLSEIHTHAHLMLKLIDNIMQVYRADTLKIQTTPNALHKAIQEAIEVMNVAQSRKPKIINEVPEQLLAMFDYNYIERVFENLLSNAIKYTAVEEKGGVVRFFSKVDTTQNTARICIQDNGKGIPKDKFEAIFLPFVNPDAKSIGSAKSVGIGLTFCKTIIEAHQSKIEIDSTVGQGTTFSFVLPYVLSEAKKQEVENEKLELVLLDAKEKQHVKAQIDDIKSYAFNNARLKRYLKKMDVGSSPKLIRWKEALLKARELRNKTAFEKMLDA